jgi:hypothetical protein
MEQVNINGTSREQLIDAYTNAASAVEAAIEALTVTAPHGRDYPYGGLDAARSRYEARLRALELLSGDLQADAVSLTFDQPNQPEKQWVVCGWCHGPSCCPRCGQVGLADDRAGSQKMWCSDCAVSREHGEEDASYVCWEADCFMCHGSGWVRPEDNEGAYRV